MKCGLDFILMVMPGEGVVRSGQHSTTTQNDGPNCDSLKSLASDFIHSNKVQMFVVFLLYHSAVL